MIENCTRIGLNLWWFVLVLRRRATTGVALYEAASVGPIRHQYTAQTDRHQPADC